jgi:diguanylate cyclase (GGDEF)-like protein
VAEKLIAAAGEDMEVGEHLSHTGASVGIAVFPTDGQDFESLLRRADAAMYASKQAGKNRCTFASPMHGEPVTAAARPALRPH